MQGQVGNGTRRIRVSLEPAAEAAHGAGAAELADRVRDLEAERERLLEMVSHLQRVAQTGLITSAFAHDVNNHVQMISGVAYLAESRSDPQSWKEALQKVQAQCIALTETTQSFLGFVRRRDTVIDTSFTTSQVVEEAQRLVEPLARRHGVTLTHSILEDATVAGDMRLAIQAVVNIVSNAVRACGGGGGQVVMTTSCPASDNGRITVTDNGPGIPDEIRQRLFRPFTAGQESNGSGLGLFIVRRTVRELGGRIRLRTSEPGTSFQIDLPRA